MAEIIEQLVSGYPDVALKVLGGELIKPKGDPQARLRFMLGHRFGNKTEVQNLLT
jgi:hypothetical protein